MSSLPLPFSHPAATPLGKAFSMQTLEGVTTYFHYLDPIDSHPAHDRRARRRRIARFACMRVASQVRIARAFGVSPVTVNRLKQTAARHGEAALDPSRKPRRRTAISPQAARRAGRLLGQGLSRRAVAAQTGINRETLRLAVRDGRIQTAELEQAQPPRVPDPAVSKGERNRQALRAPMGMAASDVSGRVAASLGRQGGQPPRFGQTLEAVECGGVLTALPALLEQGLLQHASCLPARPACFYTTEQMLLQHAFQLLARVRNAEQLRYRQPAEWGALLGLDRGPCERTLRERTAQLADAPDNVRSWHQALAREWLAGDPYAAATLCVDGHVKVYTGRKGRLPKHFVSRQKLCLPAAASYWLNALGGRPFLCWHQSLDAGMVRTIRDDLLPELQALGALGAHGPDLTEPAPGRPQLTLVFDREGWSPRLFQDCARRGVACLTWRKGATGQDWPQQEFRLHRDVSLHAPGGERHMAMQLAERSVTLAVQGRAQPLAAREIRRLDARGRQVPIVTTHPQLTLSQVAAAMFSRWGQENYFKYCKAEFGLDHLPDRTLESLAPGTRVVNPDWRETRRLIALFRSRHATRLQQADRAAREGRAKAARSLRAESRMLTGILAALQRVKRRLPAKIDAAELDHSERLDALAPAVRLFHDTLRMLAYRAETSMVPSVAAAQGRHENARATLKALFRSDANLLPDAANRILRVQLLHLATRSHDRQLRYLIRNLNETGTRYPGTDLKLVYGIAD